MPTLQVAEASLSYAHFLYLVSSIIVSIFHITWLDTFWTDLAHIHVPIHIKEDLDLKNSVSEIKFTNGLKEETEYHIKKIKVLDSQGTRNKTQVERTKNHV